MALNWNCFEYYLRRNRRGEGRREGKKKKEKKSKIKFEPHFIVKAINVKNRHFLSSTHCDILTPPWSSYGNRRGIFHWKSATILSSLYPYCFLSPSLCQTHMQFILLLHLRSTAILPLHSFFLILIRPPLCSSLSLHSWSSLLLLCLSLLSVSSQPSLNSSAFRYILPPSFSSAFNFLFF